MTINLEGKKISLEISDVGTRAPQLCVRLCVAPKAVWASTSHCDV